MAITTTRYGPATPITITLNSLSNGVTRESLAVDNRTNKYLDVQLALVLALGAGLPAVDGRIDVFAAASVDATTFTDPATGLDANLTLRNPSNLIQLGSIWTPTQVAGLVYRMPFTSIAAAMGGGILPSLWSIIISNNTGVPFATSGNSVNYVGVWGETL